MTTFTCTGCNKIFDHKGTYDRHINRKISCNADEKKDELVRIVKKEVKKIIKKSITPVKSQMPIKRGQSKVIQIEKNNDVPPVETIESLPIPLVKRPIKTPVKISKKVKMPVKRGQTKPPPTPEESEASNESEESDSSISSTASLGVEIATREDLKEKIHSIHNFLRNNGVGYGMNALKVFNLFYGLARIEEKNLFSLVELNPECKFSVLLELSETENINHLIEKVHEFQHMLSDSKAKSFVLFATPRNIKVSTLAHLIKEVDYLIRMEKTINMQLAGKLYEYFVGRDKQAISEMGAYFTDRHIVDFIYSDILEIKLDSNGNIPTMIDPFGGSGGFTIGYISHMIEKYPDIDWSKNLDSVYHIDMNDDVVKYAGLEFMCLTQYPPKMDENIRCQNTFTFEFPKKYKLIITNPPYGGDKNSKSAAYNAREKIRKYLIDQIAELDEANDEDIIEQKQKQLKRLQRQDKLEVQKFQNTKVSIGNSSKLVKQYAKTHKLIGNDKEAVSLILMMCLLEEGGTAVGVLKEGVFFDKKYASIRKHLTEKFNIISVTSVDAKQFENTSTKTSIIRFDNTGKTKKVEFYDLSVNKHEDDTFAENENGDIYIASMKGEINGLTKELKSTATVKQLKENNYSLNAKEYKLDTAEVPEVPDGYKLVKLGEVCTFLAKSKRNASYGKSEGEYPFYTSSDVVKYCDTADYTDMSIIVGTGGNSSVHLSECFSCSADNLIMTHEDKNLLVYLFNYIKANFKRVILETMSGSTIGHVTLKQLKELEIPIPEDEEELKSITERIMEPYNAKLRAVADLKELESKVKARISEIIEKEDCIEYKLGDICEIKNSYNFGTIDYDKNDSLIEGTNYPLMQNGDSIKKFISVDHPKAMQSAAVKGDILICARGTINIKLVMHDLVCYRDLFRVCNVKNCTNSYLYNYLLQSLDKITASSSGSIVKGINSKDVKNILVKIPKNKDSLSELDVQFRKIEKIQKIISGKTKEYEQVIKEVF